VIKVRSNLNGVDIDWSVNVFDRDGKGGCNISFLDIAL